MRSMINRGIIENFYNIAVATSSEVFDDSFIYLECNGSSIEDIWALQEHLL